MMIMFYVFTLKIKELHWSNFCEQMGYTFIQFAFCKNTWTNHKICLCVYNLFADHTGGLQWLFENLDDPNNPPEIYAHRLIEHELANSCKF